MEPAFQRHALTLEKELMERELARLKRKEEQDSRMLALCRLLSGLAHEINNPLTFMKGNAELLEGRLRDIQQETSEGGGPTKQEIEQARSLLTDLQHGIARIGILVKSVRAFGQDKPASSRLPGWPRSCAGRLTRP